jgi:hypothetical protein
MNRQSKTPVFLQKASYRQRRLQDAAKLVPLLGAVLWMMPLAWQSDGSGDTENASALLYIFGVWVILIAVTAILSRLLRSDATHSDKATSGE